jgi:hypothetical protein
VILVVRMCVGKGLRCSAWRFGAGWVGSLRCGLDRTREDGSGGHGGQARMSLGGETLVD